MVLAQVTEIIELVNAGAASVAVTVLVAILHKLNKFGEKLSTAEVSIAQMRVSVDNFKLHDNILDNLQHQISSHRESAIKEISELKQLVAVVSGQPSTQRRRN